MKTDLAKLYDEIADNYDLADRFGSLSKSRKIAAKQLQQLWLQPLSSSEKEVNEKKDIHVLDLGVGDGAFLEELLPVLKIHFADINLTGVDISQKMLELASKKVPLKTIQGTVHDIEILIGSNTFDLVIFQFILAYVDMKIVFEKAASLLKKNGYISMVTAVAEGTPKSRALIQSKIDKGGIKGLIVQKIFNKTVNNLSIPNSLTEIENTAKEFDLEIVQRTTLHIPIVFESLDEFMEISFKGGWMANLVDHSFIPTSIALTFARIFFNETLQFPLHDIHSIEVVLLKK